jgi:DNA-binding CsgD family transcriptional regulator
MIIADHHLFLASASEVDAIIQPLKDFFGITSFVYQCNYQDGSEIRLSNQPQWIKFFYEHELFRSSVFEHQPNQYKKDVKLWLTLPQHSAVLTAARLFNIDHGITLINPIPDGVEFAFFGTTRERFSVQEKYLRNLDLLQHFMAYFKQQAAPLLQQAEKSKIYIPNKFIATADAPKLQGETHLREAFLSATELKKLALPDSHFNQYLTSRELVCAKLLITGATMKEIAQQLGVSPRTIETHINNMKAKLNCHSLSTLRQQLNILLHSA